MWLMGVALVMKGIIGFTEEDKNNVSLSKSHIYMIHVNLVCLSICLLVHTFIPQNVLLIYGVYQFVY